VKLQSAISEQQWQTVEQGKRAHVAKRTRAGLGKHERNVVLDALT